MQKHYWLLLLFSLGFWQLAAQDITVRGTVVSAEDGLPLPGATIVLKGTTEGTVSDLDGMYSITAPSSGVLVFSFVGMETQEVAIGGRTIIDIEMTDQAIALGELVVVGYSTSSKKLLSGSVELVSEERIRNIPTRTIDGVLLGQTAGLVVSPQSGTPGGQNVIRLRGGSSINASNQPLIVIDGIPMITGEFSQVGMSGQELNAMTDINPNDIESMTILKDASATSIYGARASNGVILITTKKGSRGKTDVSLNTSYGLQTMPRERLIPMMNAAEWNEYKGTNVQGIDTDWMSEILVTAPTANTELSVSSGNDKFRLFISGNYYDQDGVIKGTSYTRYSGRLNADYKILSNLTIGGSMGITYSSNDRVEGDATLFGPLPNAMSIPAIYPVYDENGDYDESAFYANPVAIAENAINQAFTNRNTGNAYVEYKFLNDFTFSSKLGIDIYNLREHSYDPVTTRQGDRYNGLGIEGTNYASNLTTNNVLQYVRDYEGKHSVDALVGHSFEKYASRRTYIEGIDFPNPTLQYIASAGAIRAASASALDRVLNSYFTQIKYAYLYRYIFTFTARADGSSKFGKNNYYGYFPAGSFAWRVSEEPFFQNVKWVDELKIRASYGLTGNDGIGDFSSLGLYGAGYNYGGNAGIAPVQLPNPDLKWETSAQAGLGFDLSAFQERVNLNVDVYYNQTSDLLLERPIPSSSGFYSISSNIGRMENRGLEVVLNTVNVDGDFLWTSSLTYAMNRNKVLSLYEDQPIDDLGRGGNRVEVGEPIGIFYGLRCLGVDPTTGNLVYDDVNGDGAITSADRVKTGDPNPDFTAGLTNVFSYKNFDLSIFLQGVYGNDIFNGTLIYLESGTGEDNQTKRMVGRWRQPGDITQFPRAGDSFKSSRFIEDGSFLRVKNITLSYSLRKDWMEKAGVKSARIYATVQNLYTFTNYFGMDPEVNYYGGSSNVIIGTDFFTYPQSRTYLAGINLLF
ncbi:MAG: TonB-dependent receptor [Saprospiraceae bacterium]